MKVNLLKEKIQHLYKSGLSTAKIAKKFNVNPETIRKFLHKNKIKVRTRAEACTKYKLDSSFFDLINTEEKAYWLGFLTADGGIVGNQLVLSLKKTDTTHIEKFRDALKSTHPIKAVISIVNYKAIEQPRLVISSVPLIKALKSLGIGERKSFTVKPTTIPTKLQTAYWRGIFDGDGHISVNTRVVELTGNTYMLKGFTSFLKKELGIISKITKNKRIWRVRHSKRSTVFLIAKLLYSSSNIHLERKHLTAKCIFEDELFHLRKNSKLRQSSLLA